MNIHFPAILMFTRGTSFDTLPTIKNGGGKTIKMGSKVAQQKDFGAIEVVQQ